MKKIIFYIFVCVLLLFVVFWRFAWDSWYFWNGAQQLEKSRYEYAISYFWKLSDTAMRFYNVGNALYHYAETLEGQGRTQVLQQVLFLYDQSLKERFDQQTQDNYDYVQSLLEEQIEDENSENTQDDTRNEEPSDTWEPEETDTQESSESDESQQPQEQEQSNTSQIQEDWDLSFQNETNNNIWNPQERGEQYQLQQSDSLDELSPEQLQNLEQHIDNLKLDQEYNQRFFGKQSQENSRDIFGGGFWGSLFEDRFWSWEKDW